jgi:hypothetical protein
LTDVAVFGATGATWGRTLDTAVGTRLEDAVAAHHRRRVARLGHGGALATSAGGWTSGMPP